MEDDKKVWSPWTEVPESENFTFWLDKGCDAIGKCNATPFAGHDPHRMVLRSVHSHGMRYVSGSLHRFFRYQYRLFDHDCRVWKHPVTGEWTFVRFGDGSFLYSEVDFSDYLPTWPMVDSYTGIVIGFDVINRSGTIQCNLSCLADGKKIVNSFNPEPPKPVKFREFF